MVHLSHSSFMKLVILTNLCFIHVCYSITHWEDIQSLKHFKLALNPESLSPGSCLSTWDFTFDPCDSLSTQTFTCGIRCDVVSSNVSRVTDLTLDRAGYSGPLTPNLNLPYLKTLDLTNNYFTGSIASSILKLTRLERLSLSSNSFNGSIPDTFPSSLEEIYLDNNYLTGPVPHALNNLPNLKRLELQSNQLNNSLPELTQLTSLYFLDISNNFISGELPASFPPNLIELTIRNNSLEGIIPGNLFKDTLYLQVLDLSYNNLAGALPAELFTHPELQQLTLSNNLFQWVEAPASTAYDSGLIALDLSNNDIHGFLPGFMGYMSKLSALSLENNKFSGLIPVQYAVKAVGSGSESGLDPFERLLLGGNYLFGLIPGPLMRLRSGSDAMIQLGDNCLYECPVSFYFCGGGSQKSLMECKTFSPVIP